MISRSSGFILVLLSLSVLTLVSCAPPGEVSEVNFLSLDFVCAKAQVADCTSFPGRKAFLGITTNTVASCSLLLKTSGIATLHNSFDYSSQTDVLSDGPDGVWGRFQSYFDRDGQPASSLERGFYRACGFIDANSNGYLDPGEPYLSEKWNPTSDLRRVFENWSPAP